MKRPPSGRRRPRVVAIVQARMGSTRLPGKVLMDIAGEPMLARIMMRLGRAKSLDEIVVATSTSPADDPIVQLCKARGWRFFRGSEDDVLDRFHRAAQESDAGIVVRICADNPCTDPEIVDEVVAKLAGSAARLDYVSNTLPPSGFPLGLAVEAFTKSALDRANRDDLDARSREHVTLHFVRNPDRYPAAAVTTSVDHSEVRWTVDYPEDLEVARKVYEALGNDRFGWKEALSVWEKNPSLAGLNRDREQRRPPGV